jgi:TolB protein
MRSDGTDLRRLTDDPHGAFGPAWSPDGGSIAYSGSSSRASVDIYTVSATGGEPTRLTRTDGVDELQPSWSPDGSRIAFATPVAHGANAWLPRQGIRTLDIRSGRVTRITDGADSMPAWSPDGDRIAFLRQPDPIMGGYRLKLMEADVDGTHARVVLPHYRINSHLHWSPDGTALSATAAGNAAPWSVYVINVETARARAVVSNAVGGDWLPGGRALLVRRHGRAARESGCARPPSGC